VGAPSSARQGRPYEIRALPKIGIVVGVALVVVAVAVVVALKNFDPFSNGGIVPR